MAPAPKLRDIIIFAVKVSVALPLSVRVTASESLPVVRVTEVPKDESSEVPSRFSSWSTRVMVILVFPLRVSYAVLSRVNDAAAFAMYDPSSVIVALLVMSPVIVVSPSISRVPAELVRSFAMVTASERVSIPAPEWVRSYTGEVLAVRMLVAVLDAKLRTPEL